MTDRTLARGLAAEAIASGKPLEWFETLYQCASDDASVIPWADLTVNPNLGEWVNRVNFDGRGRRALVVGCGLGDDAEALAVMGCDVTAFDIAPTCINWCLRRFPDSPVDYHVADLFALPAAWHYKFDFVLEAYTLQVLPDALRPEAIRRIAECIAPGGTLLVITRGRDPDEDSGAMPWPLTRSELSDFGIHGLAEEVFEDYIDDEVPPVRRFRIEYRLEQ